MSINDNLTHIKTRFAPSPTGYLHVGGARTALFNYLFAKKFGGTFLLRIEDTDPERSKPEYSEQILISMKWLGLDWDEGPYHQSERMHIYQQYTQKLLEEGKAYRCFCTPEELEEMREQQRQQGLPTRYDGRCSRLTQEEIEERLNKGMPFAVRLKVPQDRGIIAWDDMVKGHIEINSSELDDFILVRSDGTPTYNFAVVIDRPHHGCYFTCSEEKITYPTPLSKSLFMKHWAGKHPSLDMSP